MKLKCIICLILLFSFKVQADPATDLLRTRHVLNRFTYGPKPGEVEALAKKGRSGLDSWLEAQMLPSRTESEALVFKLKTFNTLTLSSQELAKEYPKLRKKVDGKVIEIDRSEVKGMPKAILQQLFVGKIMMAAESENQLREVMVDFWFNHFNVSFDKGKVKWFITSYERESIRPYIFGNFKNLLLATAKSPAMLFYLDNAKSHDQAINENYARELLELHTLGVDGGYTQKDIQAIARVLTGWSIEDKDGAGKFRFRPREHDRGTAIVLGQTYYGEKGVAEGERLISALAIHPSTAKNVARKLAVKFISDHPTDTTINEISQAFLKSKGDLKEVYRAVFKTEQFWKTETRLSKIKTPLEYFVSSVRALNAKIEPSTERFRLLHEYFEQSGQDLYRCQPPTGFKATSEYWVNPGALINRINLALNMTSQKIPQVKFVDTSLVLDLEDRKFTNSREIFEILNERLFTKIIKESTITQLGLQITSPKNYQENDRQEIPFRYFPLSKMFGLLLSTPEMQRR